MLTFNALCETQILVMGKCLLDPRMVRVDNASDYTSNNINNIPLARLASFIFCTIYLDFREVRPLRKTIHN